MEVVHDCAIASESAIIEAVSDCGYGAEVWKKGDVDSAETRKKAPGVRTVQILVEGFCE
jgi:hypothetical protein